jgi:hypothetical protein
MSDHDRERRTLNKRVVLVSVVVVLGVAIGGVVYEPRSSDQPASRPSDTPGPGSGYYEPGSFPDPPGLP